MAELNLNTSQREALHGFLHDQLQEQWDNALNNLINDYEEDLKDDLDLLCPLVEVFWLLDPEFGHDYLMPWDDEEDPLYDKFHNALVGGLMIRLAPTCIVVFIREISFLSLTFLENLEVFWFGLANRCVDELMERYHDRT